MRGQLAVKTVAIPTNAELREQINRQKIEKVGNQEKSPTIKVKHLNLVPSAILSALGTRLVGFGNAETDCAIKFDTEIWCPA